MGVPLMLFAFIATVIGGMGSLTGAVVGGFAVGLGLDHAAGLPAAGAARRSATPSSSRS